MNMKFDITKSKNLNLFRNIEKNLVMDEGSPLPPHCYGKGNP